MAPHIPKQRGHGARGQNRNRTTRQANSARRGVIKIFEHPPSEKTGAYHVSMGGGSGPTTTFSAHLPNQLILSAIST